MTGPQKTLAIGGIGLLLGFGLCGLDALMPHQHQEFGGTAAFLGFVLCIASAASLVMGVLWLLVAGIADSTRGRK